ncbi:E3 ubiquitin- ligase NEDD4-like, partial [Paramuricea clavata]
MAAIVDEVSTNPSVFGVQIQVAVKMSKNDFLKGGQSNQQLRILRVVVLQATNLAKKDVFGLSDPYCKIVLKNESDAVIDNVKTNTIKKTLNPEWNQQFDFRVDQGSQKLLFEVFDENRLTRDDFLGKVDMPLTNIPTRQENMDIIPKEYNLTRRSERSRVKGSLKLVLYFDDGN